MKSKTSMVLALFTLAGTALAAQPLANEATEVSDAATQASAPGTLVLTTNGQQQQIEIEIGPAPNEVRVFGIEGVPDGESFFGINSLSLTTGNAQDFVEVRVFTAQAPSINLNTAGGNSDVVVRYFIPGGAGAITNSVTITGGSAEDKATFEVVSETSSFAANWVVNHGNGTSNVTANVNATEPSSFLGINLATNSGNGQDSVSLSVVTATSNLAVGLSANTGLANDSAILVIDGIGSGSASLTFNANLGDGNDVAEALAVWRGGSASFAGTVLGGNNDDQLRQLLEGNGSTTLTLVGGNGNDNLDIELKGAVSGTPRIFGGAGNDFLRIIADAPALLRPFLDGGPGFDEVIGFGTIINAEKIN